MSDSERTSPTPSDATVVPLRGRRNGKPDGAAGANGAPDGADGPPEGAGSDPPVRRSVRIRKLRVFALLGGIGALAAVSTVFGMMMAVASDLPALEEPAFTNSVLLDRDGKEIGLLTGNQKRVFLSEVQIAPVMKHAIISIEDRRFYTNEGVDLRGIGRALYQDVVNQKVVQGGSTITQQFVKNSLAAQDDRTLFVKLREAALAYHLTRKWSKERILRNYLNTIYFGNGAYGIGAAAQTYFGTDHVGCQEDKARPCAAQLEPQEAALLAGVVASPSGFDPIAHPVAARQRRDLVLQRMAEQGFLTPAQHASARAEALPTRTDIQPPVEATKYPYFTSWIKQQVVDKLGGGQTGARRAFEGGLRVRTTIDSDLQDAASAAIDAWLPNPAGPRAALVAIQNLTGEVRAMVGGDDYATAPFNLATQGQRQPGSSFKPFVLAEALTQGISPESVWTSKKKVFTLKGGEKFTVNNYEGAYSGVTTLARATTFSDNSVYAEVGAKVGPGRIARLAEDMGIRTPVSRNYANALGGLREGVTPLDMAHAYETFAQDGKLTYGTMSPGEPGAPVPGPVGIRTIGSGVGKDFEPVELPNGKKADNRLRERRVLDPGVASTVQSILQTVVQSGTATRAQVANTVIAGKTGTTENYGDAWFVGWTKEYTVAVWVGYPDELVPMKTEFQGEPVAGGTFPAGIFKTFVESALRLDPPKPDEQAPLVPVTPTAPTPGTAAPSAPTPAPTQQAPTGGAGGGGGTPQPAPKAPAAPQPKPAPDTGDGGTDEGGQQAPPPSSG